MVRAWVRAIVTAIVVFWLGSVVAAIVLAIAGTLIGMVIDYNLDVDVWENRLGVWGSYTGPVIALLTAVVVAKLMIEEAVDEHTKEEETKRRQAAFRAPSRPIPQPQDLAARVREKRERERASLWVGDDDSPVKRGSDRGPRRDRPRPGSSGARPAPAPTRPLTGTPAAPGRANGSGAPGAGSTAALPFGGRIGSYRLQRRIGAGGMGAVYEATGPTGRSVALKVMSSALTHDPSLRTRFEREARALQALPSSRRLPAFIDSGNHLETPYLVMDYVAAPSLRTTVPLPVPQVETVALQLAQAIATLHSRSLSHRDIKPDNVLWSPARGVCLVDFGIAYADGETHLTLTGGWVGTPGFMAPENFKDQRATAAADVWSWATVVCFAATGHGLFGDGSAVSRAIRTHDYDIDTDVLDSACDRLSPTLADLVRTALAEDPAARPAAGKLLNSLH